MPWINTYKPGQIPPKGTISGTRPGLAIARAISEMQDKVITDVEVIGEEGIEAEVTREDNTITITLRGDAVTEGLTGTFERVTGVSINADGDRITIERVNAQYENGVLISRNSISAIGVDVGGLPDGGTARQVLQRNESGDAVWDWVRFP